MNSDIKSISEIVSAEAKPIEDRRALIAELRHVKNLLEAKLPALALVRLTNLLRRLDAESQTEGQQ